GGGARARQEPERGVVRLATGLGLLARLRSRALRAGRVVAARGAIHPIDPRGHGRGHPARGPRVLSIRSQERRGAGPGGPARREREVTTHAVRQRRLARGLAAGLSLRLIGALAASATAAPLAHREVLDNGIRLLVAPRPAVPVVVVRAFVEAGSAFDPPDAAGLADLTAPLLTRGTARRTPPGIGRAIEVLGGPLESDASRDGATVTLAVLKKDLELGLDLLAEVLMQPSFPEDEIKRKASDIEAELKRSEESPETVGGRALARLLYPGHPYAHPVPGTVGSVSRLTRQQITGFHRSRYRPDATILAVVGDVTVDGVRQGLTHRLGGWAAPSEPKLVVLNTPDAPPVVSETISRELAQATVLLGRPGIAQNHPDYFPLVVANYVLGGGSASHLYVRVREDAGLAYYVGSAVSPGRYGSSYTVSLPPRVDAVGEAVRLVK